MLKRIATTLWGKFESWEEVRKFLLMAFTFGIIIAVYWALRPIKDSIFNAMVGGKDWLWLAKNLSVAIIIPLVIVYSKLIDKFPRQKVFYGLLAIYAVLTACFAYAFMDPVMGLANTVPSADRYIGWAWYVFVESFGSLIVALFWVIATDITLPDSARRGFPIIALFGQIGNIFGPFVLNTRRLGLSNSAPIVLVCAILMMMAMAMMWYFMHTTPKRLLASYHHEAEAKLEEPGFLEGLKLLFSNAYLMGIFFIVSMYELIVTVIDFHFKQTTFASFSTEAETSSFLSDYATMVGIIATACIILGINNIQRLLGMRASLILLPLLLGLAILTIAINPSSLTIAFWIMALSKAVNYALNQPTLKQLYIPTSKEARYKSQGWIEMFGSRSSKAIGFTVGGLRKVVGLEVFLYATCFTSLGIIGCWILILNFVAKKWTRAVEKNEVVC